MELFPELETLCKRLAAEQTETTAERAQLLKQFAEYIIARKKADQRVQLNMICTHNSRRSHITQLMARLAAAYYKISEVSTFSGGTEATAFHPNTVTALKRLGIQIEVEDDGPGQQVSAPHNPNQHYRVRFGPNDQGIVCFSKKFNEPPNPTSEFAAIMTCDHADQNCPVVFGCDVRIALTYEDPKVSDGTPQQDEVYEQRALQIGREMLQIFHRVKETLG